MVRVVEPVVVDFKEKATFNLIQTVYQQQVKGKRGIPHGAKIAANKEEGKVVIRFDNTQALFNRSSGFSNAADITVDAATGRVIQVLDDS